MVAYGALVAIVGGVRDTNWSPSGVGLGAVLTGTTMLNLHAAEKYFGDLLAGGRKGIDKLNLSAGRVNG